MQTKQNYIVGAKHQAFGEEGTRKYYGTQLGATRAAAKIARKAGHGWSPVVHDSI